MPPSRRIPKTPTRESAPVDTSSKPGRKRKRNANEDGEEDHEYDMELQVKRSIGTMDGPLLADYFARQIRRHDPDLSVAEMEDQRLPAMCFVDTTSWAQDRTLATLPQFLEQYAPVVRTKLSEAPKSPGAPHTLVICGAGLRAADVTRALRRFQTKTATVGKLFAKHIKFAEAAKFCKTTRMNIGVGTPQRVIDLLDAGALKTTDLRTIVVDASWSGPKKRTIMDMAELAQPTSRLLSRSDIKQRYLSAAGRDPEDQDETLISLLVF